MDSPGAHGVTVLDCGGAFVRSAGGRLTLTGRFPASVSSTEQAVSGTVEVASELDIHGVVTAGADVFLVQRGHVVTTPVAQDLVGRTLVLAAGQVEVLPGQAALTPCAAGKADRSLAPGIYELWARVVLNHDDGSSDESFGGPWPFEVR